MHGDTDCPQTAKPIAGSSQIQINEILSVSAPEAFVPGLRDQFSCRRQEVNGAHASHSIRRCVSKRAVQGPLEVSSGYRDDTAEFNNRHKLNIATDAPLSCRDVILRKNH